MKKDPCFIPVLNKCFIRHKTGRGMERRISPPRRKYNYVQQIMSAVADCSAAIRGMCSPYRHRVPFSYCHRRYTIFRLGCGIQSEPDADDLVICLYNVVVGGRTERRSAQPDAKAFKLSSYCPATEHYTSRHWRF